MQVAIKTLKRKCDLLTIGFWYNFNDTLALFLLVEEVSSPEEVDDFIAESAIMLDFHHPNVLRLVGVCFDTEDNLPVIVLPFMANGDLKSFLKSKKPNTMSASVEVFPEVRTHC